MTDPVDGRNHIFAIDWHYEYWFGDPSRTSQLFGREDRYSQPASSVMSSSPVMSSVFACR